MKTVIAYLIVIVLGQFVLTIGVMLFSLLCGFTFFFLPVKIKVLFGSVVAGLLGSATVTLFAYYVFSWLTGSFSIYSFGAAVISTLIPIRNDYKKYQEVKQSIGEISENEFLANEQKAMVWGRGASVVGEILGLILGAWWFFH